MVKESTIYTSLWHTKSLQNQRRATDM